MREKFARTRELQYPHDDVRFHGHITKPFARTREMQLEVRDVAKFTLNIGAAELLFVLHRNTPQLPLFDTLLATPVALWYDTKRRKSNVFELFKTWKKPVHKPCVGGSSPLIATVENT
jgi:hypothetical protein